MKLLQKNHLWRGCKLSAELLRVLLIAFLLCASAPLSTPLAEDSHEPQVLAASTISKHTHTGGGATGRLSVKNAAVQHAAKTIGIADLPAVPICRPQPNLPPVQAVRQAAPGLNISITAPVTYPIYGNTAAQIQQQLLRCAPGGMFSASTDYWIGSQFSYVSDDRRACKLTDVAITLRIRQVFPQWTTPEGASAALRSHWQYYIGNLHTHEQGHVAINQYYARQALSELNALPSQPCSRLNTTVNQTMGRIVAAMKNANIKYDARTGHGATQGAIWP